MRKKLPNILITYSNPYESIVIMLSVLVTLFTNNKLIPLNKLTEFVYFKF